MGGWGFILSPRGFGQFFLYSEGHNFLIGRLSLKMLPFLALHREKARTST
jgi:hypothetical protein